MWILSLLACVDGDAPIVSGDTTEIVFEVPKGATGKGLGDELVSQKLAPSEWQWKWFIRSNDASCIKAGKHAVSPGMSMRQVLESLCGAPIPDDEPFTVVEGWRIRDIDEALAAKGWITAGDYIKLAESKAVDMPFEISSPTLEGYLYPETYMVEPARFSTKAFIERQLTTFQERFLSKHKDQLPANRDLNAIVVMASMLEREEPNPENRPIVAGILWKRLDNSWNLGVDATSRYTLADWNDRKAFLVNLRDPHEPYNSRLRPGLPPTAIGNPALPSLEAALAPVESEYWYYLHDSSKGFHGGKDVAEHEANRKKYDVW